uniref:SFRICE_010517 n=1 Tax=Spodoptera frugiperda TaxID=7108 RepID=A0A2H1VK68_SPOFR
MAYSVRQFFGRIRLMQIRFVDYTVGAVAGQLAAVEREENHSMTSLAIGKTRERVKELRKFSSKQT